MAEPISSQRPLVLIVDDHDDTREMYMESLALLGFQTAGANGCADACRSASARHPDIIVTDLTLGDGVGWDLQHRLKDDAATRDIPVVVLTGHSEASFRERAEREGCAAFVVKPCLPDELATELERVVHRNA
jgi:two-component system, cell cycle response regulator DivK